MLYYMKQEVFTFHGSVFCLICLWFGILECNSTIMIIEYSFFYIKWNYKLYLDNEKNLVALQTSIGSIAGLLASEIINMDFTNVTLEAEANRFIDEFQEITEPRSNAIQFWWSSNMKKKKLQRKLQSVWSKSLSSNVF